jgi:hypothetical protein
MRSLLPVAILAACALSAPARGETLNIESVYPAGSNEAAALSSIRVDRFGGTDGEALAFRIEDSLRGASIGGRPYFQILSAGSAGMAEGLLRGTAEAEMTVRRYTEDREECVKDDAGKCTPEKRKFKVRCQARRFELSVMMRLTGPDDALIWSDDRPEVYEDRGCEDASNAPRTGNSVVRDLVERVGKRIRIDLAPYETSEQVRVNEGRKGLAKPDGERFRQAVRLTKTDQAAACVVWEQLDSIYPDHQPTQFNIALCDEMRGRDESAQLRYRRIVQFDPRYQPARDGLARISIRDNARRQMAAQKGR